MSQRKVFTLQEFNDAFKKHKGDCIVFDPKKYRDLPQKKGSKENYDVTYLPLQFKDAEGTVHDYAKFAFSAFTCSKARPPHGCNINQLKHVNLTFKTMSMKDLAGGDYVPKNLLLSGSKKDEILTLHGKFTSSDVDFDQAKEWLKKNLEHRGSRKAILKKMEKTTDAGKFREWIDEYAESMVSEQNKENKAMDTWLVEYKESTDELIKTLDNMQKAWEKMCKRLIAMGNDSELEFDVQKDTSSDGPPKIGSIKQSDKKEGKGKNRKVHKFDEPLYRLKLAVYNKTGQIGNYNYNKSEVYPTVFDSRKASEKNKWAAVPAKVIQEEDGKKVSHTLTHKNVGRFITYKSLINGQFCIKEATMSKSGGISSKFEVVRAEVLRHKPGAKDQTVDAEETKKMRRDDCSSDEEDEDMGCDDPAQDAPSDLDEDEARQAANANDSDAGDASSEGEAPSSDSESEEEEAPKKSSKKKTKQKGK